MSDENGQNALTQSQTGPPVQSETDTGQVSEHLRQAARTLAMQSGSRRGIYRVLGLRPRRRDLAFRLAFVMTFLLCLAFPLLAGTFYYLGYVTPQYEAETRFVLRSALPALPNSQTPRDANIASLKIVQDTLVVANFLESPSLVQQLDAEVDLDSVYSRSEIDALSRLSPGQSLEDKTRYFEDFIDVHVSKVSGIITLKARAFTPQDAQSIIQQIFAMAEDRVNRLNSEIWTSVLEVAERNFETASEQLRAVRTRYGELQNASGVFSVELEAKALTEVLYVLRKELIDLKNRRASLLLEVSETHISVVHLNRSISVRQDQVESLKAELASAQSAFGTLSDSQQLFDELEVKIDVAQERFKLTAGELEQAKLMNTVQMLYLERFMLPALPQDSVYPVVTWELAKLIVLCLAVWGLMALGLGLLQKRLD
ncbi:hypothetical protein [Parasedimentitalea maritima]|uniref:Capsular polysaccharide transport system permease protein n=1 Tax=Parasedimentitalea maritima TaxID=2578117 RepID=A0A6A4RHI5_9RHOB|nr:hypothetical protein [Zongyanglinia marina]KAE9629289.1 hypothetical protein GP644_12795 [Zongyanglinia marina]